MVNDAMDRQEVYRQARDASGAKSQFVVAHGQWIPCDNGGYYCSNCDTRVAFRLGNHFCPNCGAKMDI